MPHDVSQVQARIRDSLDTRDHQHRDSMASYYEEEHVLAIEAADEEQDDDDADEFKPITDIPIPEWVQVIAALTGISELAYRIQAEKDKRADDCYQNPYKEVDLFVNSVPFEVGVGFVILLNCGMIGWEASVKIHEDHWLTEFFNVVEHFFTIFFVVEWSLRVLANGWVWIFSPPNFADTVLVFGTGVLIKWVFEPLRVDVGNFRIMTVLRALRLIRLAHTVRLQPMFKEMWILVQGLKTSARPLLWTLVIANSVLYVFAIAATEIIGRSPEFKDHAVAQEYFGNFLRSMFTMVQVITMDTYCDLVIRPMMEVQPWLAFFFVFFITVGVFIVMNLVTAIIVDNAFKIIEADQASIAKELENKKRAELKNLSELFFEIDTDGSGELSHDEFFNSLHNKKVKQMMDVLELNEDNLKETWDVLDDGDGQLTIKEFTDGIRRMKGEAKAKDIADVIKKLNNTKKLHAKLEEQAARYEATLEQLDRDAEEIARNSAEVVSLFKEMYHRLQAHIAKGEKEDRQRVKEQQKLEKAAEGMVSSEEESEDEEEVY